MKVFLVLDIPILIRWMLLLCGFSVLATCAAPTRHPKVLPPGNDNFKGISSLYSPDTPSVRIMIIHGIGTHCVSFGEPLIVRIANQFGLQQIPPAQLEGVDPPYLPSDCKSTQLKLNNHTAGSSPFLLRPLSSPILLDDSVPDGHEARLYIYRFSRTAQYPPTLSISFLLWSPLTYQIKYSLSDLSENGAPKRQVVANKAKQMLQSNFADAVLYAGSYRSIIRPSIEAALCELNGGAITFEGTCRQLESNRQPQSESRQRARESNFPTVVITHSLGSYMLMDALTDMQQSGINRQDQMTDGGSNSAQNSDNSEVADKFIKNTKRIFMLANQLPLLELTSLAEYPKKNTSTAQLVQNPFGSRQIVAFSDPNDILSYYVTRKEFPSDRNPPINVYMGNGEWEIPGFYSDITGAHGGYVKNDDIVRLMVCGMKKGTVDSENCPEHQ